MSWSDDVESEYVRAAELFESEPLAVRDGIPSWTTDHRSLSTVNTKSLTAVVEALETQSLREALQTLPESSQKSVRDALFVDPADAWRISVSEFISGRCLDINAGVGTRSLLLAELSETVDAADRCHEALRFLDQRDDYDCEDRVRPIHAGTQTLPEPTTPYDTIVADCTGPNRPESLSETVESLSEFLADDGAIILQLDGWPRTAGLTDTLNIGSETASTRALSPALRTATIGYERLLSRAGFDTVDLYALVPDGDDPSFVLPVGNDAARRRILDTARNAPSGSDRLLSRGASIVESFGILDRCWPAYLAVCHGTEHDGGDDGPTESGDEYDISVPCGLLRRGGGRSTVFTYRDRELEHVTKIPHRRAHSEFILDEHRVTNSLRTERNRSDGSDVSIAETIPSGSIRMTWFGPTYTEAPMSGTPLSEFVTADPERFRRVLELGFRWLTHLHRSHGGPVTRRSGDVVREELSFPEFDLEPPAVDGPTRLFRAPCHGDFHPKNVFVERDGSEIGPVTAVIDWELAGLDDNPIADAGFFALQTARLAFGSLRDGVDEVFASPGAHGKIVREVVSEYCSAVGITREAFVRYLPIVWIRRLKRCADRGATASYSGRACRRAADVEYIWERESEIATVLGIET